MAHVRNNLRYTPEHEWLRVRGTAAFLGVTDYAQDRLGDIVFADGEPEGSELAIGDVAGVIEAVKGTLDILTPVTGVVLKVNKRLTGTPEVLNDHPYDCWLIKLALKDAHELDDLMNAADYAAYCTRLS